MEESTLIQNLKTGQPAAFEKLVTSYQDRVINTCFGFLQNMEDAEDTAQEVFIEVYKSIDSFRADSKVFTWIYQIAVRKSLDFLRKKKRLKRFGTLKRIIGLEVLNNTPSKSIYGPEESLENKERRQILMQAVEKLPENQKIAFTLSKYEDLSYKEIAAVMDTTVSSVESLLFRAKKNLQKSLEKFYKNKII